MSENNNDKLIFPNSDSIELKFLPLLILGPNGSGKTKLVLDIIKKMNKIDYFLFIQSNTYLDNNWNINDINLIQNFDIVDDRYLQGINYPYTDFSRPQTFAFNLFNFLFFYYEKLTLNKNTNILEEINNILKKTFSLELKVQNKYFYFVRNNENILLADLSSGEKRAIYILVSTFVAEQKIIAIDEPELFFNEKICLEFWILWINEMQKRNNKIIFISHSNIFLELKFEKIIFVKNFDFNTRKWDYEFLEELNEIHRKIIFSFKDILLTEGTSGSYENQIYSKIYKNFKIVPVGSKKSVADLLKSDEIMKITKGNNKLIFGLIDSDNSQNYRYNEKIKNLNFLNFYEIENLFLDVDVFSSIIKTYEWISDKEKCIEDYKNTISSTYKKLRQDHIDVVQNAKLKNELNKMINSIIEENLHDIKTHENDAHKIITNKIENYEINKIIGNIYKKVEEQYKYDLSFEEIINTFKGKKLFNDCFSSGNDITNKYGIKINVYLKTFIELLDKNKDFFDKIKNKLPILKQGEN